MTYYLGRARSLCILLGLAIGLSLAITANAWAVGKGQLDTSFGSAGTASLGSNTRLFATAVQSDGKVVAVGASGYGTSAVHLLVVRFTTSGQLDSSFSGGQVTGPANTVGQSVAIQSDGKIVVAGTAITPGDSSGTGKNGIVVARFNSNGSPDGSFGSGGTVGALTNDPDGQGDAVAIDNGEIVVTGAGSITNGPTQDQGYPGVAIVRVSSSGHVDSSTVFDLGRNSIGTGVAIQPDGKIVVSGTQRANLQTTQAIAARFNSNGTQDTSFAGGLFQHQYASNAGYSGFNSVALQPNGDVVLAGGAINGSTGVNALFVRLTSSGALDGSFGSGGALQVPASNNAQSASSEQAPYAALGVAIAGGEIFATGWYDNSGERELAVWGVTGGGSPDTGFGTGGVTLIQPPNELSQGNGIAIASDGSLLVAGEEDTFLGRTPTGVELRFGGNGSGPSGGGGGGGGAGSLSVTVGAHGSYKRSYVRKHGIPGISIGCNRACKITATLLASSSVGKALHIHKCSKVNGHRMCTLITVNKSLGSAGKKTLTLNNSQVRHAAAKFSKLTVTLKVTVSSQGVVKTITRKITIK